jgi:hypothetical protein
MIYECLSRQELLQLFACSAICGFCVSLCCEIAVIRHFHKQLSAIGGFYCQNTSNYRFCFCVMPSVICFHVRRRWLPLLLFLGRVLFPAITQLLQHFPFLVLFVHFGAVRRSQDLFI